MTEKTPEMEIADLRKALEVKTLAFLVLVVVAVLETGLLFAIFLDLVA
jgi:hypothetical protein